jgi:BlaI family penicillinase repressor
MKSTPRITDTEWEIMRAVWAGHPVTAAAIVQQLRGQDPSWHPKTVRTLLARLVKKKALDYQAEGRAYVYEPLLTEHECRAAASDSFLSRVFGGSLKPMLAYFAERQKLTRQDLEELEKLLDSRDSQPPKKGGSGARH